jgi:hypothetical protein
MSSASRIVAAVLLLALLTVEVGGGSLLAMLTRRMPGYLDNPLRHNLFRAMHAHAGVWVLLALVGMLHVDQARLPDWLRAPVRATLFAAPGLVALGFSLSVVSPKAQRPNGLIGLVYLGGLSLAAGAATLGVGLLRV